MKKWASAFKTIKVADSLASAGVSRFNYINNDSFGFAVLDEQIVMVHGAFYGLYLPFPLSFWTLLVITLYEKSAGKGVLASATVLGATSRRRLATDAAIEEAEE